MTGNVIASATVRAASLRSSEYVTSGWRAVEGAVVALAAERVRRVDGCRTRLASLRWAVTWTLATEPFCYLTTRGRVSGRPRRIELWFALDDRTVCLLSGGRERSHWVKNLRCTPDVTVALGGRVAGRARIVEDPDEDARARTAVHDKYAPSYGGDLSRWRRTALPVAVDLGEDPTPSR